MSSRRGARARILLVDDDRAVLTDVARMIENAGHEALVASTWSEALRLSLEGKLDLVLLDVMMPTLDGFKLTRILKQDAGVPFMPVILLTALGDEESKRRGMSAGADDFLTKPVAPIELEMHVSSMLRIKQLTDALEEANTKLSELAVTDPLTGLHNRRALFAHLEREFARARRYSRSLALLMLDLDHFKRINDTLGHPVGDRVLRQVADAIRGAIRATDFAGRFGGEEFIVLAPETGRHSAGALAERLRVTIAAAADSAVTVSIGVATTESAHVVNFDDLVHLADEALYRAKREGRDRVAIADD